RECTGPGRWQLRHHRQIHRTVEGAGTARVPAGAMRRRAMRFVAVVAVVVALLGARSACAQTFTNFESGHVRPLALSPDGSRLFAVNTPDNRLAIYGVGTGSLTLQAEVPVGLEPVAVAARSDTEVWVVNHLSD